MYNVNFWNWSAKLYVNGVECARRSTTILDRGDYGNSSVDYKIPLDVDARGMLQKIFWLNSRETFFTHKPYYKPSGVCTDGWLSVASKDGRLYETDIKTLRVDVEYTLDVDGARMNKLFDYPAGLVVDYLKERGMTICPLNTQK